MRNFNAPSTHTPELANDSWGYGDSPVSAGAPMSIGGGGSPLEWMSTQAPEAPKWGTEGDWGDPVPGSYETSNPATPPGFESTYNNQSESRISERLRELKDKVIHGVGRKALDAVMNRLSSLGGRNETLQNVATNLYENPGQASAAYQGATELWANRGSYAEQAVGYAKEAGREVAGAGLTAAKESVMKYYGLEKDENEKLRVARKLKFGKAVVKTVVNPIGTASSVGTRAGYAARKASVQSAKGHIASRAEAARNRQPQVVATPDNWASNW